MNLQTLFNCLNDKEKEELHFISCKWKQEQYKSIARKYCLPDVIKGKMQWQFGLCTNKLEIIKMLREFYRGDNMSLSVAKVMVENEEERIHHVNT